MAEENKTLNYELPPELYEKIKAEADRLGLPIAGFMRMLAVHYFERREEQRDYVPV